MTNGAHVLLSSNRYDWRTPDWFLNLVRQVAVIGFDPCTTPDNPTGALRFMTQQLDADGYSTSCGLLDEWPELPEDETGFFNPPYGPHLSGPVDPNFDHYKDDKIVGVGRGWAKRIAQCDYNNSIVLVPVRTGTKWWRTLFEWSHVALLWGSEEYGSRINFVDGETGETMKGSNLDSTVFGFGAYGDFDRRFCEVFEPHGILIEQSMVPT